MLVSSCAGCESLHDDGGSPSACSAGGQPRCRMEGCPGHTLRWRFHHTSDIDIVEIDGKSEYHLDENLWHAMARARDVYKAGDR